MAGGVHGMVFMCGMGACVVGGACMAGGHAWQGACVAGGVHGRGMRGRRNGHCSGRYASYWNAYLLSM